MSPRLAAESLESQAAEASSAEAAAEAEAGAAAKDASGEPIELKKILEDAWRK